jgi:hypothetical protein
VLDTEVLQLPVKSRASIALITWPLNQLAFHGDMRSHKRIEVSLAAFCYLTAAPRS